MKNTKLTICFPSYNRIEKLKQSLKTLLKQININQPDVRIMILDNFSFEPYENNLKNDSEIQPALNSEILKIFRFLPEFCFAILIVLSFDAPSMIKCSLSIYSCLDTELMVSLIVVSLL